MAPTSNSGPPARDRVGVTVVELLTSGLAAALFAGTADGIATALQTPLENGLLDIAALTAFILPFFLAAGLGASLAAHAAANIASRATQLRSGALMSVFPAAAVLFVLNYQTALVLFTRTNNRELAALVCGFASLASLLLGAVVWWVSHKSLGKLRTVLERSGAKSATALILGISLLPLVIAVVWALLQHSKDLSIVGVWVVVGPMIAVVTAVISLILMRTSGARARRATSRVVFVVSMLSVALAVTVAYSRPDIAPRLARQRTWAPKLVSIARGVTDFDGDGYSSHFGGGDCAGWNSKVHPGASEVLADGIDNNCVGGDQPKVVAAVAPAWIEETGLSSATPNIIVITVEALRADANSVLGERPDVTPNLLAWSRRAIVFRHFYAASSQTVPSLTGLWSSRFPGHVAFSFGSDGAPRISADVPWIPELLQQAGFRTGAVMSSFEVLRPPASIGFERGFSSYDTSTAVRQAHGFFWDFPAHEMIDRALAFVKGAAQERFLLWIHLLEPHAAYEQYPGAPVFGETDEDRYRSELWGIDAEVGRFLAQLEESGLLDRTIVFLTGDHGESFGERGRQYHGNGLSEVEVHTLAMLWAPGLPPRVIDAPASHCDVGPTLMNLAGVRPGFDRLRGRNLIPLLQGRRSATHPIALGYFHNTKVYTPTAAVAYIDWPWKLIMEPFNSRVSLYDLQRDPRETEDLSATERRQTGLLQDKAAAYFEASE